MTRILVHAAVIAAALATQALADERVLLLSAYPPEQAVLLAAAGVDGPEDQVGVFNGHRFFAGRIGAHDVILGLTGIGMVDSHNTTAAALQYFSDHGIAAKAVVFSGVAGGPHIGDVVVPDRWTDGADTYPVNECMFSVVDGFKDEVELNPYLPVEDAACTGQDETSPPTPIRVEGDPQLHVGGLGSSGDPFGGRAVPCFYPPEPPLLGCDACGAPINTSPDPIGSVQGALPFLDPDFFADLSEYFSSPGGGGGETPVVGDMETAAAAEVAAQHGIPFLAFRAASDAAGGNGDPIIASAIIGFPVSFFLYQQLAADNAAAVALEFFDRWSPAQVSVSPAQAVVRFGKQQQFTAAVSCPDGAGVVWTVQEPGAGTIDANGLYTAPRLPTAIRSAHVVATSAVDGSVRGVAAVSLRVSN